MTQEEFSWRRLQRWAREERKKRTVSIHAADRLSLSAQHKLLGFDNSERGRRTSFHKKSDTKIAQSQPREIKNPRTKVCAGAFSEAQGLVLRIPQDRQHIITILACSSR